MKHFKTGGTLAFLPMLLVTSCIGQAIPDGKVKEEDAPDSTIPSIILDSDEIIFTSKGGSDTIRVSANVRYTYETDKDTEAFASVTEAESFIIVSCGENRSDDVRRGCIRFRSEDGRLRDVPLHIVQSGLDGSRESDSLALVSIYHLMNGPSWIEQGSGYAKTKYWLSEEQIERWQGVTTDSRFLDTATEKWRARACDGRVTGLGVYCYSDIPECIGELKRLRKLELWGDVTGALPECISELSELKYIDIYCNGGHCNVCCKLEEHPMGKIAPNLNFLCIEGDIWGNIPLWFSKICDDATVRCDFMHSLSGRIADEVMAKGFMSGGRRIAWSLSAEDGMSRLYDIEGSTDADYFIINAAKRNLYALWYGPETPEKVRFVADNHGGHWEWETLHDAWEFVQSMHAGEQKQ